ncbi:MAG: T9SS type A sorting domain-containing protein [Ignavibacteria bacterium]|jgi:hypothetical protein
MKSLLILLALNISFISQSKILDTSSTKYFPLSIGNVYVYVIYTSPPPSTYSIGRVIKDTILSGIKYYYCEGFPTLSNGWYRTDSITGSLYLYNGTGCHLYGNDALVDSLAMRTGNFYCYGHTIYCNGETPTVLFGIQTKNLTFGWGIGYSSCDWTYTKYFGCSHATCSGTTYYVYINLVGCVVNGVLYGDTTINGIEPISNPFPESFMLSQNYPNPFNPTTKIKFFIPLTPLSERGVGGFITLKIYDLLGHEVAILVNQQLKPGTYEVEWDGTDYPSGIYFYKLTSESFSESKRMVLLK